MSLDLPGELRGKRLGGVGIINQINQLGFFSPKRITLGFDDWVMVLEAIGHPGCMAHIDVRIESNRKVSGQCSICGCKFTTDERSYGEAGPSGNCPACTHYGVKMP